MLSPSDFNTLKQKVKKKLKFLLKNIKIEAICIGDKKNGGLCELDIAIDSMISTQRIIKNTVKDLLKKIFEALDVLEL